MGKASTKCLLWFSSRKFTIQIGIINKMNLGKAFSQRLNFIWNQKVHTGERLQKCKEWNKTWHTPERHSASSLYDWISFIQICTLGRSLWYTEHFLELSCMSSPVWGLYQSYVATITCDKLNFNSTSWQVSMVCISRFLWRLSNSCKKFWVA